MRSSTRGQSQVEKRFVNTKQIGMIAMPIASLCQKLTPFHKHIIHITKMSMASLTKLDIVKRPPTTVSGMTVWDPDKFRKQISVPYIEVQAQLVGVYTKHLKDSLLKMPRCARVRPSETDSTKKQIIFDPDKVKSVASLPEDTLNYLKNNKLVIEEKDLKFKEIELTLDNWTVGDLLDAVLMGASETNQSMSSFTNVGHIIQVNLKEEHLPFKNVIGNILLRTSGAKLVVNKTNIIDNTFRNFAMEVLAGDGDMVTTLKENYCQFRFDFSKVYWNSKLGTEHERIINKLELGDVLFDVFAGVGPFAIPAAKKGVKVFANDLNPESFKWLQENVALNKVKSERITCFNMDGRDFIQEVMKDQVLGLPPDFGGRVHVTMNLPALAIDFLDAFVGMFEDDKVNAPITVYVYSFTTNMNDPKGDVLARCRRVVQDDLEGAEADYVRNVAPNKDMYRTTIQLPKKVMSKKKEKTNEQSEAKRIKLE